MIDTMVLTKIVDRINVHREVAMKNMIESQSKGEEFNSWSWGGQVAGLNIVLAIIDKELNATVRQIMKGTTHES